MPDYKILDSVWFNPGNRVIGIVAVETFTDQWKAYIDTASGYNQKLDEQMIAARGAGLRWDMAHAIFPRLDIRKYKDAPEESATGLTVEERISVGVISAIKGVWESKRAVEGLFGRSVGDCEKFLDEAEMVEAIEEAVRKVLQEYRR